MLAQTESVFALSNGHVGLRGNLDEGEPHGLPGTYLNGFYELRPLPYAEAGYGYPESGQTIINVTNGKLIRLLVDDEPFDVRYGQLRAHERSLDLRAGVLHRERRLDLTRPARRSGSARPGWCRSPSASVARHPLRGRGRRRRGCGVVVQSELVANEALPAASETRGSRPALERPLVERGARGHGRARRAGPPHPRSGLRVAAAMDHVVDGPGRHRAWNPRASRTGPR